MEENKSRFYWLKMPNDFFKRHDLRILESMENGKEYVLFYVKLMLESIDHDGQLRFSERLPYTAEMLATVTNTEKDIVNGAMDILSSLGMVRVTDDGTFVVPSVSKMIDSVVNSDEANRQRRCRERKKQRESDDVTEFVTQCHDDVTEFVTNHHESKSKSKIYNIPPIVPHGADVDAMFDRFWMAYPRRVGKSAARKAFEKIKPSEELLATILDAVAVQSQSDQWKREGGQYIPYPSTWLNQGRWEDEVQSVASVPARNFLN